MMDIVFEDMYTICTIKFGRQVKAMNTVSDT